MSPLPRTAARSLPRGGGVLRLVLPDDPRGTPSSELVYATPMAALALSPDGRQLLVLAGRDPLGLLFEELILFDLAAHTSRRITTHGERLFVAAFDPSGRFIVTGDHDGIVRVGPVTGEEPHLLLGHHSMVESLAVSPDGRWIATATEEGLYLWPMPDMARTAAPHPAARRAPREARQLHEPPRGPRPILLHRLEAGRRSLPWLEGRADLVGRYPRLIDPPFQVHDPSGTIRSNRPRRGQR